MTAVASGNALVAMQALSVVAREEGVHEVGLEFRSDDRAELYAKNERGYLLWTRRYYCDNGHWFELPSPTYRRGYRVADNDNGEGGK